MTAPEATRSWELAAQPNCLGRRASSGKGRAQRYARVRTTVVLKQDCNLDVTALPKNSHANIMFVALQSEIN